MSFRFCTLILSICFVSGISNSVAEAQDPGCGSCKFFYDPDQHVYVLKESCKVIDCYCPIPIVAEVGGEANPVIRDVECVKSTELAANEVLLKLCQADGSVTHALKLILDPSKWPTQASFKVISLQAISNGNIEWEIQITFSKSGEFSQHSASTLLTSSNKVIGQSSLFHYQGSFGMFKHFDDAKTNTFQFNKNYQVSITRK